MRSCQSDGALGCNTTWLEDSLQILGHYDPELIRKSLNEGEDLAFQQIALWLEDRVIRLWDVSAREKLRSDFWSSIGDYLDQLECPNEHGSEYAIKDDWMLIPRRRTRVMYWLVSCAISEAYGDSTCDTSSVVLSNFPLGFTTDDPQVDTFLTLARMNHLDKLRKEQDQINGCIVALQQTSVNLAKPLKARKRR